MSDIKPEIFKKYFHEVTEEDGRLKIAIFDFADEYASEKDKEIERLKEKYNILKVKSDWRNETIESLKSELNKCQEKAILWDNLSKSDKLNSLVDGESKFCEKVDKDKIKRLESELSELKEKRKEEIEKAYKDGRISMISSSSEVAFMTPEQYYTQTYGQ